MPINDREPPAVDDAAIEGVANGLEQVPLSSMAPDSGKYTPDVMTRDLLRALNRYLGGAKDDVR